MPAWLRIGTDTAAGGRNQPGDTDLAAADWALREGLLFDQKGRLENHDIRQASVDALALRFHVNMEKATAVEKTALNLLTQVAQKWQLTARDLSVGLTFKNYHRREEIAGGHDGEGRCRPLRLT
mgnify:CR=1 FL=1